MVVGAAPAWGSVHWWRERVISGPVRAVPPVGRRYAALVAVMALVVSNVASTKVAVAAGSPIGAHSMLQLNSPYSFKQAMFAEAAGMHASAIRLDVAPYQVFPDQSMQPEFAGLDEVMALSEQYHLRVVADLFTVPTWMANCQAPTDPFHMTRCGTDDLADYRAVIALIVAHADPVIRDWEIWNEPDIGEFFTGTAAQYALMLRTAHDAIKAIDPRANVLLGGISSTMGMTWLASVFTAPGADAAHTFDVANIHERGRLDALAPDLAVWKHFLAGYGFTGPLWVTEHGYPSDPTYQYDPEYRGGLLSQAKYLMASIPTLIDAGAAEVFVTERDNLAGQFASEGVVGGDVFDPPVANPTVVEKPAYAALRTMADCYTVLGRDCPSLAPSASPTALTIPATRLRSATISSVLVSDPGPGPLPLGAATLVGGTPGAITIQQDECSTQLLEPDRQCTIMVRFHPLSGGATSTTLLLPSNNGTLSVKVTAVSPSVSSLRSPPLPTPEFTPTGAGDGVGHTQRLVLRLNNPLSASVQIANAQISGLDWHRFLIRSNTCAGAKLGPGSGCRISVLFTPTQPGTRRALLTLRGDGMPLTIMLRANPIVRPTIALSGGPDSRPCLTPTSHNFVLVYTNNPSIVTWQILREQRPSDRRCKATTSITPAPTEVARSAVSGRTTTAGQPILIHGIKKYVARFMLPIHTGRNGLTAGTYRLTVTAIAAHAARRSATTWLTVVA
jgi:hypothetical protein